MSIARYEAVAVDSADPGDLTLYSVTSILATLSDGDGLVWWAARQAASWAIDHQAAWQPLAADDRNQAVKVIADAHRQASSVAADRGGAVHDLLERWVVDGRRPDPHTNVAGQPFDASPWLDSFDAWLRRARPAYEAAEMTVYSPRYGYAGTLDAIAVIDGVRFLIDYKTKQDGYDSRGKPHKPTPYKAALQLCAYARAEFAAVWRARRVERAFTPRMYALSPDEQARAAAIPDVDAGLVVMVTPEHTIGYPFRLDDTVFRSWLHAIENYRWVKHTSRSVMGAPLDLPEVAA